jgi:hypothetical protein
MRHLALLLLGLLGLSLAPVGPAEASGPPVSLERLSTCGESWLDWKANPAVAASFRDYFLERFEQEPRSGGWQPRRPVSVFGLPVVKAYPQSVGMAVGFSLEVRGTAGDLRRAVESAIGRPLQCERAEGALGCEAELGERRTAMVVAADAGRGQNSLIGCYYFYQP